MTATPEFKALRLEIGCCNFDRFEEGMCVDFRSSVDFRTHASLGKAFRMGLFEALFEEFVAITAGFFGKGVAGRLRLDREMHQARIRDGETVLAKLFTYRSLEAPAACFLVMEILIEPEMYREAVKEAIKSERLLKRLEQKLRHYLTDFDVISAGYGELLQTRANP